MHLGGDTESLDMDMMTKTGILIAKYSSAVLRVWAYKVHIIKRYIIEVISVPHELYYTWW
jgi:hypothetical protein